MRTIIRLFGHGVGGRPSKRIMGRLGMPICHTSILRQLRANAPEVQDRPHVRVAGIDEWAWLEQRRREGITNGRQLFGEIVERGYTGSYSHLARFLTPRTDAGFIVRKLQVWRDNRPVILPQGV